VADSAEKARLLISLLAAEEAPRSEAVRRLAARFGPLIFLSEPLPFAYTDYYQPEMGAPLTRRLAAFLELVEPERLSVLKGICLSLESDLAVGGKRRVNIDPGLLSAHSLVLATTKNSPHRICLAPGRYAEVTLIFQNGEFKALPWTYPDYAGKEVQDILHDLRRRYLWQLKEDKAAAQDRKPPGDARQKNSKEEPLA